MAWCSSVRRIICGSRCDDQNQRRAAHGAGAPASRCVRRPRTSVFSTRLFRCRRSTTDRKRIARLDIEAIGRLAPGVPSNARRFVRLSAVLREQFDRTATVSGDADPRTAGRRRALCPDNPQGAVGSCCWIACANVSSLLIARGTARARGLPDPRLRRPARLIRHLLAEPVLAHYGIAT